MLLSATCTCHHLQAHSGQHTASACPASHSHSLSLSLFLSPSTALSAALPISLYLSLSLSLPLSLYLLSLCIPFFAPLSLAIPALPVALFTPGINMQLSGCTQISGQLSTGVNAPQMQRGSGLTARHTCGDGLAAYDRIL